MAITALENFSGLPTNVALSSNGNPFGFYPGQWVVTTNGTTQGGKADGLWVEDFENKRWLTSYNSGTRWCGVKMDSIFGAGNSRIIIGIRMRRVSAGALSPFSMMRLDANTAFTYSWQTNQRQIYVELVIDRADWTFQMWVNGRLSASGSIGNSTTRNTLLAASGFIDFAQGSVNFFAYTDMYVIQDTNDDSPNSRIGPQDISAIPLEVDAATPAIGTWTTAAMDDIQAREYLGADSGTRVTGEGLDARLRLKAKAGWQPPNDTAVNGVGLMVGATFRQGSPGDLRGTIKRGTHEDTLVGILTETSTTPQLRLINQTRSSAEQRANTAFNGFAVDLKLESR